MTISATLHRASGALTTLSNGRHAWLSDVNKTLGSDDRAPDPHDLLDSALAACTALTLELYIRRRQMAVTDLQVHIERSESRDDQGVVHYQLVRQLTIEGDVSDADRAKLMEIANKCPIHRILEGKVTVETALVAAGGTAATAGEA
jgi:putative redox protein